jgi:phenylpropionate dioxygenase-like ring-hydroxylating dioxygenase large terminal subunit
MTADLHLPALYDEKAFAEEQARLGQIWTLVGYASDIPGENDWFRTLLGGRSVFIQRFADGLRGFENRCAHRSYPLRTAERGNGPILCGFHHWRYDSKGTATGIPNCKDAFGTTPRELGRSLVRLDMACCGELIFARFPGRHDSLEAFLGPAFEVLALLCADLRGAGRASLACKANWRLLHWINLDEYHLAAVHPGSFGAQERYLPSQALNYMRCGPNSAYFLGAGSGGMTEWLALLRAGSLDPVGYRIINLITGGLILLTPDVRFLGQSFRYLACIRNIPLASDRSEWAIRFIRLRPNGARPGVLTAALNLSEPVRLAMLRWHLLQVLREDRAICEELQRHARQIAPDPIHGASEIRVAWFNAAYAEAMRPAEPPP